MNTMRVRTTRQEVGDLAAEPGSRPWAIAVRDEVVANFHNADFSTRQCELYLRGIEEEEAYKVLKNNRGDTFGSMAEFCLADPPFGLGLDLSAAEFVKCSDKKGLTNAIASYRRSEIEKVAEAEVKLEHGGDHKSEEYKNQDDIVILKSPQHGNSLTYTLRRLKRDRPCVRPGSCKHRCVRLKSKSETLARRRCGGGVEASVASGEVASKP